jgi:Uma2 family endonuclease
VRVPACDKYYYPDVTVVCEPPQFEDGRRDTLLNPTLLIEVLSDSTQATDRDEKWQCYQTLESLQSYVLISQNKPLVEIYRRQADGWFYTAFTQLESVVPLDAIGCELKLAEVYARVPFPPHPNQEERGEHD